MAHATTSTALRSAEWPAWVGLTDEDEEPSVYDHYPELFAPLFPELDAGRRACLAAAGRDYASAVFTVDHLLDGDRPADTWAAPLRITALLHEAYVRLAGLFEASSPFWQEMARCLAAYMEAMEIEARFVADGRRPSTWRIDDAVSLARGKCAVAELVPLAMAHLVGDRDRATPLVASIAAYNAACTLLDDLLDWRADLATGRPNFALAENARRNPRCRGTVEPADAIGRALYFGGSALAVLAAADAELATATAALGAIEVPAWRAVLEKTRRRIATMREQVTTVPDGRTRSHGGVRGTVRVPRPADGWGEVGVSAGRWLVREGEQGFPEGRHLMRFPHAAGFTGATEIVVGDVFTHAVATAALCDLADASARGLEPLLDVLREHLVVRRRTTEVGLWSYFPDLPELPPDADDLAEVLRVLVRTGGTAPLDAEVRRAVSAVLAAATPEGAVPTWIVGGTDPERTARQQRYVTTAWGTGCEVEVVANIADAVGRWDPVSFGAPVARARRWVADRQLPDGSWAAEWYHGGSWATWVATRCLAADPAHRGAVRAAARGLLERQQADGGWGPAQTTRSSVFDTVLSAMTLRLAAPSLGSAEGVTAQRAVDRALRVVAEAQEVDGSFAAEPVIRMDVDRVSGGGRTVSHGSATLVTAVVVRAALALSDARRRSDVPGPR